MKNPPNILFFFPDQHRHDYLEFRSDLPLRTPNLNQLAAEGVYFNRAFCASPLCGPSRASLASGRNYERCGVINNKQNFPLDMPTYYKSLRSAGYRVATAGKLDLHKDTGRPQNLYWNLDGSRNLRDWGFTEGIDNEGKMDGITSYNFWGKPAGPYTNFLEENDLLKTYLEELSRHRETGNAYVTRLPDNAYCDNWISENGLNLLKNFPSNTPWYLQVNFAGPHSPMNITNSMHNRWKNVEFPLPYNADLKTQNKDRIKEKLRNYAAMIENIDRQVGRFLKLLRERGETNSTIIVYSSDHGEMLGEHGIWGKSTWREAAMRIPLIISGPDTPGTKTSESLVSLFDLAATFVDYANAPEPSRMDAITFRNIIEGITDTHRPHITGGLDDWKTIFDGKYKLVLGAGSAPSLFDLEKDKFEENNIAEKNAGIVKKLSSLLREESRKAKNKLCG